MVFLFIYLFAYRDIRREAAVSCTKLIVRAGEAAPTRGHSAVVVGEVLEKLLVVGIADPGMLPLL
jgi:hypothetical protein